MYSIRLLDVPPFGVSPSGGKSHHLRQAAKNAACSLSSDKERSRLKAELKTKYGDQTA
jgi:hypothetical protein